MKLEDPLKLIGEIIYCSARFENLVSRLYEQIVEKAEDKSSVVSLIWLSTRSKSNAEFLDRVLKILGLGALKEECKTVIGLPWRVVEEIMSEVDSAECLSGESIVFLLKKLNAEDSIMSIETYHKVLFNLLRQVLPYFVAVRDAKVISEILQKMSKEEETHEEVLTQCFLGLSQKMDSRTRH
ncbi:MAG: hypothetical protein QXY43_05530 [Sulfolobales archaeon]